MLNKVAVDIVEQQPLCSEAVQTARELKGKSPEQQDLKIESRSLVAFLVLEGRFLLFALLFPVSCGFQSLIAKR